MLSTYLGIGCVVIVKVYLQQKRKNVSFSIETESEIKSTRKKSNKHRLKTIYRFKVTAKKKDLEVTQINVWGR